MDKSHKKKCGWITMKEPMCFMSTLRSQSHADDSELTDDDVIIRYEKGSVVGMTFLHARKKAAAK